MAQPDGRRHEQAGPRPWRRLLALARPHAGTLLLAVGAALAAAVATSVFAALLGPALGRLLGGATDAGPAAPAPTASLGPRLGAWLAVSVARPDTPGALAAAIVVLAAVKASSTWLHGALTNAVAQRILGALRRRLYEHLLSQSPRALERWHSGDLLSRMSADVAALEVSLAQTLTSVLKDSLLVLALVAVCASIDAKLLALAAVVLPGMVLPVALFSRWARRLARGAQGSLAALSTLAAEQLHNLALVQVSCAEPLARRRFDEEQRRTLDVGRRSLLVRGAFTPSTELLGIVGVAVALGAGARSVGVDPALGGQLVSFVAAALLLYQPVKALAGAAGVFSTGLGAAERVFELLDTPAEEDQGAVAPAPSGGLRFEAVGLSYGGGRPALDDVSFELAPGAHVALVGPSGAGKSSVLSLILRFVEPSAGAITWGGAPLSAYTRASLRARMAWVPQEPVLLSGSVRENLRWGRADASERELWEALERAHAADFVRRLPAGLDEPVGERGGRVSGGQRQRLAIARAFLRRPSLLLLDEPTSALDPESEAAVQAGLAALMAGCTTLVVAHRLATVREADLILVLDGGRVVERGTHATLAAGGALYARLLAASSL